MKGPWGWILKVWTRIKYCISSGAFEWKWTCKGLEGFGDGKS